VGEGSVRRAWQLHVTSGTPRCQQSCMLTHVCKYTRPTRCTFAGEASWGHAHLRAHPPSASTHSGWALVGSKRTANPPTHPHTPRLYALAGEARGRHAHLRFLAWPDNKRNVTLKSTHPNYTLLACMHLQVKLAGGMLIFAAMDNDDTIRSLA
jgi:hypothetical protein